MRLNQLNKYHFSDKLPIMKKFPGRLDSFKLLYVKSNTSNKGKAPNPRGSVVSLFILYKKCIYTLLYGRKILCTTQGSKFLILVKMTGMLEALQFDYWTNLIFQDCSEKQVPEVPLISCYEPKLALWNCCWNLLETTIS